MDTSDIAKFVAILASLAAVFNVVLSPEQQELIIQIILAVVTIVPLATAMLKKDPKTGKQINLSTGEPEGQKKEITE